MTCSTCHASWRDGALVPGLGNASLDLGRLAADGAVAPSPEGLAGLRWGAGRVDVSSPDGSAPVRIPDLRHSKLG